MPQIQKIDEFKSDITILGNEEEIRTRRGENMPEITPPVAESADELSALFEDDGGTDVLDEAALFNEPAELLPEQNFESEFEEEDFNLPSDLIEGLEEDLDAGSFYSEEPEEAEPMEDDFSIPEGLTEDFGEVFDEEAETPDALEAEGFGDDLDSFDLEGFDEEIEQISEPDAAEELDMQDFEEDAFEISDFDEAELDISKPAEAGSEEEYSAEGFDNEGFDTEGFEAVEGEDDFSLEDFSLGEIDDEDIEASEFSLGDLGQEFGVDEEIEETPEAYEGLELSDDEDGGDFDDAYSDENYAIPDDDYIELKKTLGQMPRNLKLVIEELIGEKRLSGENLDKLVNVLVSGAGAKDVASVVSRITGKKVRIPAQYERRTAEEFEKEKASFAYLFRRNFIPMFRTAVLVAAVLGLFMFLGYRFIYTPIHAESLYKRGYEEIPLGNNDRANEYFAQGFEQWRKKKWFYRYAESYTEHKQYILAEEKYEQLIGWYPEERQAVLDYAELEFRILGKYPEAEKLLTDLLFDKIRDYDARLMLGDTYMEWAREIDASKYEEARFNYAKLLEQFGNRDEILFRMLRYFVRTDNYTEAMKLYAAFSQNEKAAVVPEIYAELAGYLIDNGRLEDVREILMKARSVDEELPEIHYELARYFDIIDIPLEESKALNAAIWLFENTSPLTRTRNGLLIDSYNRYGTAMYEQGKYLDAEEFYQKAAGRYDEALSNGQITPAPRYGLIFSNLGDLSYYISGDYDQALKYYEKSEENEYSPAILKYKKGYIHYNKKDYRDALVEFYDTAGGFSIDRALMYSTANTLFNRNDYYLAEGYYTHLLDILEREFSSINYLLIDDIPEHRSLLENMMKVSNNLGVTKYRLYERSRDPQKNAESMVLLTDSVEYYDKLTRDPESLIEPETVNLSYLNSRAVFYPVEDYRLQIYQDIPKDLSMMNF